MTDARRLPEKLRAELCAALGVLDLPEEMARNLALAFAYYERLRAGITTPGPRPTTRKGRSERRPPGRRRKHGGDPHNHNYRWVLREALISNVDHGIGGHAITRYRAGRAIAALLREADRREGRDPGLDDRTYDCKREELDRWFDEADEN